MTTVCPILNKHLRQQERQGDASDANGYPAFRVFPQSYRSRSVAFVTMLFAVASLGFAACGESVPGTELSPLPQTGNDGFVPDGTDAEVGHTYLFQDIFPHSDTLQGNSCYKFGRDRCRGWDALWVCKDDVGQRVGDNTRCSPCTHDGECDQEYPYYHTGLRCVEGSCQAPGGPAGENCEVGALHCQLASLDTYVCTPKGCGLCENTAQCAAEYANSVCVDGVCGHPSPPPTPIPPGK
jgi:hypothetical protein